MGADRECSCHYRVRPVIDFNRSSSIRSLNGRVRYHIADNESTWLDRQLASPPHRDI